MENKNYVYENSIILIGPIGVGKSLLSATLSNILGLSQLNLDDLRSVYYPKYGFDKKLSDDLLKKDQKLWLMYQKQFEIKMVEDILSKLSYPAIIDFGASQAHYFNESDKQKIAELLKPFNHVINLEFPNYATKFAENETLNKSIFLKTNQYKKLAKYSFISDIFDPQGLETTQSLNNSVSWWKVNRTAQAIVERYRIMQHVNELNNKKIM